MNTVDNPEISMAKIKALRYSKGKFFATLLPLQSSRNREQTKRIGILRRLL